MVDSPQIDYSQYQENYKDPFEYDFDKPLSANLDNLFRDSLILPSMNTQLPILISFLLMPSAMATIAPILYLIGEKGTGKSTFLKIASAVHNCPIISSGSTFASLRNTVNKAKWWIPENCEGEKNCIVLFDNASKQLFAIPNMYEFFLTGYDRSTDLIQIAIPGGENLRFRTFCPKVISSIHPLYLLPGFDELERRVLPAIFRPFNRLTDEDRSEAGIESISELADLDGLNLGVLNDEFNRFWVDERNLVAYNLNKRQLKKKKGLHIPKSLTGHQFSLSTDLLVTGLITEVWDSLPEALEGIAKFWNFCNENAPSNSALVQYLEGWIARHQAPYQELARAGWSDWEHDASPHYFRPSALRSALTEAHSQGWLGSSYKPSDIDEALSDMGWVLERQPDGSIWYRCL